MQKLLNDDCGVIILTNLYGINEGFYNYNKIAQLLRDKKNQPDAVQFIADMIEE